MDINERLQNEQLGVGQPKINPDEQRRYLGTFRERVIAAVKKSQLNSPAIQAQFEATLKQHTDGKVLISQPLAGDLFTTYVRMAVATNHPFTLLSTNDATTEDDPIAVLLAADEAVNIDQIYFT